MKNIQTTLNIILAAAIAVLFFLQFKGSSGSADGKSASKVTDSAGASVLKVAYVDLDSIQVKYTYYKEKTDEFARKNESAERDVNNALQKLENERVAFLQRGQSITQSEAERFQQELQRKFQNIEGQKKNLEKSIQSEGAKTMEDLKKRIDQYLVEYNKKAKYSFIFSTSSAIDVLFYKDSALNITNDVVAGLNAAYNNSSTK